LTLIKIIFNICFKIYILSEEKMRLNNKIAIITGAGDGIGKATAVLFAKECASVVVADLNQTKGLETVNLIKSENGKAMFLQVDVSKSDSVKQMVKDVVDSYGRIDILINNAGVFRGGNILDTTEEDWDLIMSVNLKGVFLCCKYSIPEMIKTGKGVIVNIGSEAAIISFKNLTAYSSSKSGLLNLTRSIALDFATHNIRANCVCPGTTETSMVTEVIENSPNPEEKLRTFIADRPAARLGRPEEIAAGILYLASDESPFATGAILAIDGGRTAGF
jgi:meso-butanediol dehydrogenase / (S,S)-butanediol dehydrogenase / diacetyl reductase